MPFFTVNFGLKTKMPSTVINKKFKINILKKKKKPKGMAHKLPSEVALATFSFSFIFFFKMRVFRSFFKLS